MASNSDTEHVDMLLALALAFGETASEHSEEGEADGPLGLLSALNPSVRQSVERRADWYSRLTRQKQLDWLSHKLGRARADARLPPFDEHVHPSHVVEALRDEPARVRELVIGHLPHALASSVAAELGVSPQSPGGVPRPAQADTEASGAGGEWSGAGTSPEIVSVVGREFLSRFTTPAELPSVTPLELLTGPELARLARLLGVRETALACRGIEAVEAVASFLRRFAPEDARAVAAHIASLTEVEPRRVRFAEHIVREAMVVEPEPGAMLDRAGLRLLAITLAGRENGARLRYTAQKLPVEAARCLEEMARDGAAPMTAHDAEAREMLRAVAREAEAVAANLHAGRRARPANRRVREAESSDVVANDVASR